MPLPAVPGRGAPCYRGDKLVTGCFIHTAPQEQVDAPDASGAESLAPQTVVEAGDSVFRQLRQRNAPNLGKDVAVDQIAVSAHCAAAPSTLILTKPAAAPLAYRIAISFLHVVASSWQTNNTTEREK